MSHVWGASIGVPSSCDFRLRRTSGNLSCEVSVALVSLLLNAGSVVDPKLLKRRRSMAEADLYDELAFDEAEGEAEGFEEFEEEAEGFEEEAEGFE